MFVFPVFSVRRAAGMSFIYSIQFNSIARGKSRGVVARPRLVALLVL